ncbi:MAG: formimidoylglutamase [Actinobacteria bacterium HGW-Actinobacteria-7]|jgi:formiminoglutamase|nr:MAG: formimidoylglutamase [Actinobacteria bacterium HGW-Actinobacteria-7]
MGPDHTPAPNDPLWPRAAGWLVRRDPDSLPRCDLALLGVPAHATSISPTGAHTTPAAIREALNRYSTYAASHDVDVATLSAFDCGDVTSPDGPSGEARVTAAAAQIAQNCRLLVALGGDNSITHSVMRGVFSEGLEGCGLITVDAHHDLRDGVSNGSPVRRLVEAGLPGSNIVQIGIADFSNSPAYAARAREYGITVVTRADLREADLTGIVRRALDIAGGGGRPVFVDLDVDVCDRAAVPGCPAAAPGGISADELRQLAFLFARDTRVRAMDITEIDATVDANDGRTVRLAALIVLEAAAGLALREEHPAGTILV